MINISSFFRKGVAEATAAELWQALQVAESERQSLREREQALSVSRQDVLLEDDDEKLDRIEAELTTVARAAERHDIRIPELRRLYEERRAKEQAATNKHECDAAVAERLKIAGQIDSKLTEIGALFAELERTAVILRRLDGYHMASRKMNGQMTSLIADIDGVRMAIVHQAPDFAKALEIQSYGNYPERSYRAHEEECWNRILHGIVATARYQPEMKLKTDDEMEAEDRARALDRRYGPLVELKVGQ